MAENMSENEDIIIARAEDADSEPADEKEALPSPGETVLPDDTGLGADRTEMSEEDEEEKPKRRRPRFFRPVIAIVMVAFCVYAVADIISQQNEIEQLRQETEAMQTKIEEAKQLNDEYQQLLSEDEDEFMKRVAVEQLGYAYPNERRYYIVDDPDD
ncbi:MAG: septum formation initiator [Ruminococcus sp.]|nr:septum formation initiator [Ruminococcus sp.]